MSLLPICLCRQASRAPHRACELKFALKSLLQGARELKDEIFLTPQQLTAFENTARNHYGNYFDGMQCVLSLQMLKKLWLQHNIRI